MSVLQYVGARYVPVFYKNPDGSWDWEAGASYEPMTIVKYGENSYTSRSQVPSTVGSPNLNPEYWANTGNYNGFISEIQADIACLKNESLVHPESFGAYGDGAHDDTDAVRKAFLAAQKEHNIVILKGTYLIAQPIEMEGTSIVVMGSGGRVESTLGGIPEHSINLKFTGNGRIVMNKTCGIKLMNCTLQGSGECLIIKSFENVIWNCSFIGFSNAIHLMHPQNWLGVIVELCEFKGLSGYAILADEGSDGMVISCTVDSHSRGFLSGSFTGYLIRNNHDDSQEGSTINAYNALITGNYFDVNNALNILSFNSTQITNNFFLCTEGCEYCIKIESSNTSISKFNVSGNSVFGATPNYFMYCPTATFFSDCFVMNNMTGRMSLDNLVKFGVERTFYNACFVNGATIPITAYEPVNVEIGAVSMFMDGRQAVGYFNFTPNTSSGSQTFKISKMEGFTTYQTYVDGNVVEGGLCNRYGRVVIDLSKYTVGKTVQCNVVCSM